MDANRTSGHLQWRLCAGIANGGRGYHAPDSYTSAVRSDRRSAGRRRRAHPASPSRAALRRRSRDKPLKVPARNPCTSQTTSANSCAAKSIVRARFTDQNFAGAPALPAVRRKRNPRSQNAQHLAEASPTLPLPASAARVASADEVCARRRSRRAGGAVSVAVRHENCRHRRLWRAPPSR